MLEIDYCVQFCLVKSLLSLINLSYFLSFFQSRNVTKKVFAIIDEVSTTILRAKVPGELPTTIHTDAILLMLQRENLRDLSVRFYHVEDGAWFKIPSEAMAEIAGSYGQDDISTQVGIGIQSLNFTL